MNIQVSENLTKLAKAFKKAGAELFIVGGYVRNKIMGLSDGDTDICGKLLSEKVIKLSNQIGFKAQVVNKNLGTVLITAEKEQFEYTTFRSDNYVQNGTHSPESVVFVNELHIDAARRDFTCNSIYYNVLTGEITDPFNGLADINNKMLRIINNNVFLSDGLRILRFVRFACQLGFTPEKKSFKSAKENAYKLKHISKERVLKEIKQVVVADERYGIKDVHLKAIQLLNKLQLWQVIFDSRFAKFNLKMRGPVFKVYKTCPREFRYVAFNMAILQQFFKKQTKAYNIESLVRSVYGPEGLKESNLTLNNILNGAMFLNELLYTKNITYSICSWYNSLPGLVSGYFDLLPIANVKALHKACEEMKQKNIPFTENDLEVSNRELIEAGVNEKNISKIKQFLFNSCLQEKIKNERNQLLQLAVSQNQTIVLTKK